MSFKKQISPKLVPGIVFPVENSNLVLGFLLGVFLISAMSSFCQSHPQITETFRFCLKGYDNSY